MGAGALRAAVIDGPRPLDPGETVAPGYRVLEHLSRGRVLDVYDVWSEERDCRCIAKTLRPDRLEDRAPRRRLLREGKLLERFTHPHIVRGYETLRRPRPAVILETVSGLTLARLLEQRTKRLSVRELASLGSHLCSAVQYLHRNGYLHLDLKPSNIVAEAGRAKLLDLSIARRPGRARPGMGTRGYRSPEQVRGDELGEAADVWGLGVVLFETATGRRPFQSDGRDPDPQLRERAPSVGAHRRLPAALVKAIDGCLNPDPARRPSSQMVARVLRDLE